MIEIDILQLHYSCTGSMKPRNRDISLLLLVFFFFHSDMGRNWADEVGEDLGKKSHDFFSFLSLSKKEEQ